MNNNYLITPDIKIIFLTLFLATQFSLPTLAEPSPEYTADSDLLELQVRIHLISSEIESLNSLLEEDEIREIFDGVNQIWSKAGIQWNIESFVREEAINTEVLEGAPEGPGRSAYLSQVMPKDNLTDHLWHVFFIRQIGTAPGVYVAEISSVIQSELDHRGVAGLEGDIVRILSHEMGHSLSLGHVECPPEGNLMAAGCMTGERTSMTDLQIEVAREQAHMGYPFRDSSRDGSFITFLLSRADDVGLSDGQRKQLEELNKQYLEEINPIREEQNEFAREGMSIMQSGNMTQEVMNRRRAKMSELQKMMQEVEDSAMEKAFIILNTDQHEEAEYLLERRAVMMGN